MCVVVKRVRAATWNMQVTVQQSNSPNWSRSYSKYVLNPHKSLAQEPALEPIPWIPDHRNKGLYGLLRESLGVTSLLLPDHNPHQAEAVLFSEQGLTNALTIPLGNILNE